MEMADGALNPMTWKREHQIALMLAIAIGCIGGVLVGLYSTETYSSFRWGALWCEGRYSCFYLLNGYWLKITLWASLGAAIGAALVWIRQLLRT